MKFIKEFFNLKTKETEFKPTIIQNLIVVVVFALAMIPAIFIPDKDLSIIYILLIATVLLYLLWVFVVKMMVISENRRIIREKESKFHLKYEIINVYISDLDIWFKKAVETETIHVKSKENIFHTITVEVVDENTRKYYLDKTQFTSVDEFWKNLNFLPIIDNNRMYVCDTSKGEPTLLVKTINELKKK